MKNAELFRNGQRNLVRFAHNWNTGLPWRELSGIQYCRCNTWGAEVIKSSPCKPGLGQGILEWWNNGWRRTRSQGEGGKTGQLFVGKTSLDREINKWETSFKTNTPLFQVQGKDSSPNKCLYFQ